MQNYALASNGATATASSTTSGYPSNAAINGDRKGLNWGTSGGWNDATPNVWPDWIQIDFNATRTISEIDVFTIQDNTQSPVDPTLTMTFNTYGITAFDVQALVNGTWTTVPGGSVTGNNKVWRKFQFTPITTTAIRVVVNAALNTYSRIIEVEARGPAV